MARAEPPAGADRDGRAESRASLVLGTAGHIDHGKTALIGALTGVDTDRLPEEQERGITIELGFAPLDLDDGRRVSVVDVPGHEKLVRTMVAGASGIDMMLLVVAADEGVMPQTREHVAICELLGLERGIVALTKCDVADEEMQELATEEVRELLAGTPLADSEILPVAAPEKRGIPELRAALARMCESTPIRTVRSGPPRLAIDRVFSMKGFGTVVTGTLVGSALEVGQAVEVLPGSLEARIRGLQSHGSSAERVGPGERCAVNLQGLEVADLSRGQVLTQPSRVVGTATLDAEVRWLGEDLLPDAFASVEFLAGTSQRRARVALIGESAIPRGGRGFVRIHLEGEPLPLLPGDRFIVRAFARQAGVGGTIGGGRVLDAAPPRRSRRDARLLADLEVFATGEERAGLLARVARTGLSGCEQAPLCREIGAVPTELEKALRTLSEEGLLLQAGSSRWITADFVERLERDLLEALSAFHADAPMRPGMQSAALRGILPPNVPRETALLAMSRLAERGEIAIEGEIARLSRHQPTLDPETAKLVSTMRDEARAYGLEPPSARDWSAKHDLTAERFRDLVAFLERDGSLVRAPGDLWFDAGVVRELEERVRAHLESHRELKTPDYKALIGTSRRSAVPLMELFDERHLTQRRGEVRVLRAGNRSGEE